MSLNIGADDFISKPYNAQVLIARIQKILERTYEAQANSVLIHKGLTINLLRATATYGDKEVDLTKNELGILRLLIVNKGNVIPRDAIIDELWQNDEFIDENTLNVNIVRLRKKLSKIGVPDYLETKRGMGYRV
jgi:DNA-binding response OmpR family regulator